MVRLFGSESCISPSLKKKKKKLKNLLQNFQKSLIGHQGVVILIHQSIYSRINMHKKIILIIF